MKLTFYTSSQRITLLGARHSLECAIVCALEKGGFYSSALGAVMLSDHDRRCVNRIDCNCGAHRVESEGTGTIHVLEALKRRQTLAFHGQ